MSQIFPIISLVENWRRLVYLWLGDWSQAIQGIDNERNPSPTDADVPDGKNLCFLIFVGNDGLPSQESGTRRETLPILHICPRSSQTIGDICDFDFSLVGNIWDGRGTINSQTVWDFPDIWRARLKRDSVPPDYCKFSFLFFILYCQMQPNIQVNRTSIFGKNYRTTSIERWADLWKAVKQSIKQLVKFWLF